MKTKIVGFCMILWCSFNITSAQNIQIENISSSVSKMVIPDDEIITFKQHSPSFYKEKLDFNYLGDGWVSMRWKDIQENDLLRKYSIQEYGKLAYSSKISPAFSYDFDFENKYERNESIPFQIHVWGSKNEIEKIFTDNGIDFFSWDESDRFLTVKVNAQQIKKIATSSLVSYIEPISEERTPLLKDAAPLLNYTHVNASEPLGLGLRGEGVKIGVWDYGLTGFHKDIEGQFENVERDFYNATGTQHTTLVTSAIAAKGILRSEYVGVAPSSKVFVYNFYGKILNEVRDAKEKYGVYITNHSYNIGSAFRCFTNYQYSTASIEIDKFVLDEPYMVHLFAAGNSSGACAYDFKTIVPGFQYAKNVIVVGNLQNNETFYPGSGKGPTSDGRLAPHVMSKGSGSFSPTTGIVLASPTDTYTNAYGTSFATPIASGIVGLMQEAFFKKYLELPKNNVVKAVLCNTAVDLGRPGPDYDYGFGKIDALQAVQSIQNKEYFEGSLAHGETKEETLTVLEGVKELKILLNWNDLPASLPNDGVLVNDLDLVIITPDDKVIYPLVLNPNIPLKNAEEGKDSINNIEQVVIKNPIAGQYTIRVKGDRILQDDQDYVISFWSTANDFLWNYPIENSKLVANTANHLRWKSQLSIDSVNLQYSIDGGNEWISIQNISPAANFFTWTTPNSHQEKVLLRIIDRETVLSVSDTFTITPRLSINTPTNCNNHIRLAWTVVPGATKYIVHILNDKNEWVNIDEITVNNYLFERPVTGKEYFFSATPVFNETKGLRSFAQKVLATNNNNCSLAFKDVGIHSITPTEGSVGTEYALTENEKISIKVVNYSNSVVNNVVLNYQVDDADVRQIIIGNMTANQIYTYTSDETYNFHELGDYVVKAWITSGIDTNSSNDTMIHTIHQLSSFVASFPYFQDFENTSDTLIFATNKIQLPNIPEWDYIKNGNGRVFNYVSSSFAPEGEKALHVDSYLDNTQSSNFLYLNIDLSSQVDSLVYLDFKQIKRGETLGEDTLYIQGSPTSTWIPIVSIFESSVASGVTQERKRINLSELLYQRDGQFSEHSVLKFKTNSVRNMTTMNGNGGYTYDDIKIYNGGLDIALESINVAPVHCVYQSTLPYSMPVSIKVKNNSPNTIPAQQMKMYLYLNDTLKFEEYYSYDFLPYQTVDIDFSQYIDVEDFKHFQITAKIEYEGDLILENNIIENYSVNLLKAIRDLPVEMSFEPNEEIFLLPSGDWYSWELGVPTKSFLYNVADNPGNAWVTKLNGLYPNGEKSYLYIGCFNPNMLNFASELSFFLQYNLEYGADVMWVEYSLDGKNWDILGNSNSGYNWYNKDHSYNYWDGDRIYWQVASMPLTGLVGVGGNQIFLRFAYESSEYIQLEGIAIDQLRINNTMNARIAAENKKALGVSTGNGIVELKEDNVIYGYLDDKGQNLGNVSLDIILVKDSIPAYRDKYLVPRFYLIQTENQPVDEYSLTLFNKNEEYVNYLYADQTARRMGEIGYLAYNGLNTDTILDNNHFDENYTFYHPDSLIFWPYNDGNELRFNLDQQKAEIYLTSNQHNIYAYPFVAITDLNVFRTDTSAQTFVAWEVAKQEGVIRYDIFYSMDGLQFDSIGSVASYPNQTSYLFTDEQHNVTGEHYYRIKAVTSDQEYTSLIDSISFEVVPTGIVSNEMLSKAFYMGQGKIAIESNLNQNRDIRLVDISGKIIDEWKSVYLSGQMTLNSKSLLKSTVGMYFIQWMDGKEMKSIKFVKSE